MNEYIEFKEEYPFIEWNDQFLMEYTLFCESDDKLTDDNLTDDIEEAVPGLYEQWLKLNDYDPKTNTISTGINRVNIGKIGSSKERNRLNQFLKRNDFDPKTGTYRSDIKLQDGSYARIPLNIGVDIPNGNLKDYNPRNTGVAYFHRASRNFPTYEKDTYNPYEIESRNYNTLMQLRELNDDIKHVKKKLNDPELSDDERRDYGSKLRDMYDDKKYYTDRLKQQPRDNESYSKRQQDYLMDNGSISLTKRDAFSKPRQSFNSLKHEEGHADDFMYGRSINQDVEQDNLDNIAPYRTNPYRNRDVLNPHDSKSNERYADIYAAKHNPYIKSSDDAYNSKTEELNHAVKTSEYNNLRNIRNWLKNVEKQGEVPRDRIDKKRHEFNDFNTKKKTRISY